MLWRDSRIGPPDANGCRRWSGTHSGGYARRGGDSVPRQLLAAKLGRPIGPGLCALHKCPGGGNRWCVEIEHLVEGTHAENAADRDRAGRGRKGTRMPVALRGERHGSAKLTEASVGEIRRRHADGETQTAIGRAFSVAQSCVSAVVRRASWAHVP